MFRLIRTSLIALLAIGCAAPPRGEVIESVATTRPAASQPAPPASPSTATPAQADLPPVQITMWPDGVQLLTLTCEDVRLDATGEAAERYASMMKGAAPGQTVFIPVTIGEARAYLDVTYNHNATQVSAYLRGPVTCPDLSWTVDVDMSYGPTDVPTPQGSEQPTIVRTYLGHAAMPLIHALVDPCGRRQVSLSRPLIPEPVKSPPGVLDACSTRATLFVPGGPPPIEMLSLRAASLLDGTVPPGLCPSGPDSAIAMGRRDVPAAGWWYAPVPGEDAPTDIRAQLAMMRGSLRPFGFDGVWIDAPTEDDTLNIKAKSSLSGDAWNRRLGWLSGAHQRLNERGDAYNWQHAEELIALAAEGCWLQRGTGISTPGPIRIGEPLSLEHARMWAALMGLSGQVVMLGDRLDTLSAERLQLVQSISPPAPIKALSLQHETLPEIWNLRINPGDRSWNVVGVFNWSSLRRTRTLVPQELDITLDVGEQLAVYDFWEQRLLAVTSGFVDIHLPPRSCRVVCLVPVKPTEPALISTSRHITQGATDVLGVKYDRDIYELSGHSRPVPGHAYELRLYIPTGDAGLAIDTVEADASCHVRREGPLGIVAFDDPPDDLRWRVQFVRTGVWTQRPEPPGGLVAEQTTRGVELTWYPSQRAMARYRLYRDGERIAELGAHETRYEDSGVMYDRAYAYAISTVDSFRNESRLSKPIMHTTPLPDSTNLTALRPIFVEQEHAWIGIDETVDRNPLRVAGRRYYSGIGTHTRSHIRYFLGGGYHAFSGEVGIDDETGDNGSVRFEIIADGQNAWTSGLLRGSDGSERFEINVSGKRFLDLIVTDGGDGSAYDHANWLDPYLHVKTRIANEATATFEGNSAAGRPFPVTQPAGEILANERITIDTSLGTIAVELDTDRTPRTVRNFLEYVDAGSYDNTIFHRVIDDFIVQGGGFDANFARRPDAPPIGNEARSARSNERGTLAMVRMSHRDSATREFFFNLADNKRLDYPHHGGGYCVFGRVVEGMDVLDKIGDVPVKNTDEFHYLPADPVAIYTIRRTR